MLYLKDGVVKFICLPKIRTEDNDDGADVDPEDMKEISDYCFQSHLKLNSIWVTSDIVFIIAENGNVVYKIVNHLYNRKKVRLFKPNTDYPVIMFEDSKCGIGYTAITQDRSKFHFTISHKNQTIEQWSKIDFEVEIPESTKYILDRFPDPHKYPDHLLHLGIYDYDYYKYSGTYIISHDRKLKFVKNEKSHSLGIDDVIDILPHGTLYETYLCILFSSGSLKTFSLKTGKSEKLSDKIVSMTDLNGVIMVLNDRNTLFRLTGNKLELIRHMVCVNITLANTLVTPRFNRTKSAIRRV